ncbi:OmpA family protein [Sediminitomix flava]|uniref:WD40 repeat protein n=1 Tax=Sediminitomix flava TaxID=379075 RepID=A0A315ZBU2_SEDFL|nr:OmpA family protein [Sediminitomix flava]PWJ42629.1 WD40 repeat protein [Sediminitomix flava]
MKTFTSRALLFFSISFLWLFTPSFGQSKKAEKLVKKAEEAFNERDMASTEKYLSQSIQLDPNLPDANYFLGKLNYIKRNKPKTAFHFQKTVQYASENPKFKLAHIFLAKYELSTGNYNQAVKYANSFLSVATDEKLDHRDRKSAKHIIEICEFAKSHMENPLEIKPEPLEGEVNFMPQQYFPVITADQREMYFTGRPDGYGEEIYVSRFEEGKWQKPEAVEELNTPFNEGTCTISADGRIMIFTACESFEGRQTLGGCDLFMSKKVGDKWTPAVNLGPNVNTKAWESQPSLSADGRTLYFVSDRQGGVGKKDIWVTKLEGDVWAPAQNLGAEINTSYDDISPHLHVNGRDLFFASEGHLGFGGLDLFVSHRTEDGKGWTTAENLGYPINNYSDQVSLFVTADGKKAYFASNINEKGEESQFNKLMTFSLPSDFIEERSGFVTGTVYDAVTKERISAHIELKELTTGNSISVVDSDPVNGKYLIVLSQGHEYGLFVSKPDYLFHTLSFDYRNVSAGKQIYIDVYLDPIKKGVYTQLNNIFFESGSYELQSKSRTELIGIANYLKRYQKLKIEISGHTDDVGSHDANVALSNNRAKAVVDYLEELGIARARMEHKGYGEEKPIVPNDNNQNRAQNRRIEFRVL